MSNKPVLVEVKVSDILPLSENPRIIDTYKYQSLVSSLREFPDMMAVRPMIINKENRVLCGNMRYRAITELGWETVMVYQVDLTPEQEQELIIKDNLSYGDWDDELIDQDWDKGMVDRWMGIEKVDYSLLDYEDLTPELESMSTGLRKAITVEMGGLAEEGKELVRRARKEGLYVGAIFIDALKQYHENT